MNTHVYVIRHAEVVSPYDNEGRKLMYRPETPISEEGKNQLTSFARNLRDKGVYFDRIETSPFTRATESAKTLADVLGTKEVVENPAFADSHIPGWFDIPLSEQQKLMDKGQDIYLNPRSDDQEKYEDIAERMLTGFNDLVKRNEGKTVAIVSHGDPIRLLMYRLGHPEGEIPNMSILSKQGYLKRGEVFHIVLNKEGNIVETELVVGREGVPGERELYTDSSQQRK